MLTGFIGFLITLAVYWVLWKLWMVIAPNLITDVEYEFLIKPKFWQFAFTLFVVLFLFRKSK